MSNHWREKEEIHSEENLRSTLKEKEIGQYSVNAYRLQVEFSLSVSDQGFDTSGKASKILLKREENWAVELPARSTEAKHPLRPAFGGAHSGHLIP
jgi:hypothetical protein